MHRGLIHGVIQVFREKLGVSVLEPICTGVYTWRNIVVQVTQKIHRNSD